MCRVVRNKCLLTGPCVCLCVRGADTHRRDSQRVRSSPGSDFFKPTAQCSPSTDRFLLSRRKCVSRRLCALFTLLRCRLLRGKRIFGYFRFHLQPQSARRWDISVLKTSSPAASSLFCSAGKVTSSCCPNARKVGFLNIFLKSLLASGRALTCPEERIRVPDRRANCSSRPAVGESRRGQWRTTSEVSPSSTCVGY